MQGLLSSFLVADVNTYIVVSTMQETLFQMAEGLHYACEPFAQRSMRDIVALGCTMSRKSWSSAKMIHGND